MKVEYEPLDRLTPYARNPRKNDPAVDAVAASIRRFGFRNPIVLDRNGTVIAGHTRLKAAKKLGMDKVPVVLADDLTEEQAAAFRLADNKTQELSSWDFSLLMDELTDIEGIDMAEFGFAYDEDEEPQETVDDVLNQFATDVLTAIFGGEEPEGVLDDYALEFMEHMDDEDEDEED